MLTREFYARLSDEQLIDFAKHEGQDLTEESLVMLQAEFVHRGIDTAVFDAMEDEASEQKKYNRLVTKIAVSIEFMESLWTFVMDKKEAGETDAAIYKSLLQKGLRRRDAFRMLHTLESKTKAMLNACDTEAYTGGVILGIGLAITMWTLNSSLNAGSFVVVAWGAIIFGTIRCFRALSKKGYYRRILENIRQEHTGGENLDKVKI